MTLNGQAKHAGGGGDKGGGQTPRLRATSTTTPFVPRATSSRCVCAKRMIREFRLYHEDHQPQSPSNYTGPRHFTTSRSPALVIFQEGTIKRWLELAVYLFQSWKFTLQEQRESYTRFGCVKNLQIPDMQAFIG